MVVAINRFRKQRDLPPLRIDPVLSRLANLRVGVFSHDHPRYGWMHEHGRRVGYPGWVTDNLFQGPHQTPEDAVDGWATSTVGHDKQMLGFRKLNGQWVDERFNRVGAARQGNNFIAVFGRSDGSRTQAATVERRNLPPKPLVRWAEPADCENGRCERRW